ncbi:Predicted ATP-dependent endonuclease of the OLD family, contains P-loop ATPase and TOPRIM domains [Amphibacillus marinus]|uniref:Predicted ATP-dependent endonuclease of the OLD family, contains P-loop ATPase and TOPRIM domains n=1 Tax=Amphibacillus marinus TaxID=872970 RepID=A0A1H8KZH7_9BACI|nr:AAA family ATPase [Amphibacillus marinus]SEN98297.1 Predicted ATP-dependent endonuclease of the OLD family, contains P-loop ATPase and TOPRIM domains [Amphibacillus marinus]
MYISGVTISNFRSFDQFNVDLNEGLSVVIGENNVGKSNFLDALNLIFNSNYSPRKRILIQEDFYNGLVIKEKWPEITIEVFLKGIETEDELAITSRWLTRNPGEAKLTYKYRPKANISVESPSEQVSINRVQLPLNEYEWIIYGGERETLDTFDFNMLSKFGIEYVGALRDATTELKKSSGKLQQMLRSIDLEDNVLQNIAVKVDELNKTIMQGEEIQKVKSDLNSYLHNITGSTRQKVQIQMGENDYDSLIKNLKVLIGDVEDRVHSVEMNGLGYNNLLFISLLLTQYTALKEKKLSNFDYIFPIIIVEEPEAHLHNHLQKYLASYFFKQKVAGQVIVTTHSTNVSSHSNLDSLIVFYKSHQKTISKRIGSIFDPSLKQQLQYKRYLERWLDATKSDIFFSRKVLLVEGIAERLLIPKFFSMIYSEEIEVDGKKVKKKRTLEGEGISVISVDGVAFRPFLHLFDSSGLNIKCAVLTDSDPEKTPLLDENGDEVKGNNNEVLKEEVYPTKPGEFEFSSRTCGLINDFEGIDNILISTNLKTFEYDLMLEDNKTFFIELFEEYKIGLTEARKSISSMEGSEFAKEAYKLISQVKGEFSQFILDELNKGKDFNVPSYIKAAFDFLLKDEEEF